MFPNFFNDFTDYFGQGKIFLILELQAAELTSHLLIDSWQDILEIHEDLVFKNVFYKWSQVQIDDHSTCSYRRQGLNWRRRKGKGCHLKRRKIK